jgi:fluoride ion exporter CrcB/FEX
MKTIALIINILGIPTTGFLIMMFITSPMMFASPELSKSKSLWALIICLGFLIGTLVVAEYFGWKLYAQGDYQAAIYAYKWAFGVGLIALFLGYLTFNK